MSDNVILLGAGASYDAGIPLLGNFMETMFEMALTGRSPKGPLSDKDKVIFSKAMKIRDTLEPYHTRVSIGHFNLEEVLSVLYFEAQTGTKGRKRDLEAFTTAIARTIELTCNVLHDGVMNTVQAKGHGVYRSFWTALFALNQNRMKQMPDILSFNYDLVLERSLFQSMVGYDSGKIWHGTNMNGFCLDYRNPEIGRLGFKLEREYWRTKDSLRDEGRALIPIDLSKEDIPHDYINIPYLKLHGSLNFPKKNGEKGVSPVLPLDDPKIIPPVFNKADSAFATAVWKAGFESLRNCKNLIICGYSLPTTDTYMQYFLKAALGGNRDLLKIHVFDPELFKEGSKGEELKARYARCFSENWQDRINYKPNHKGISAQGGTFSHLTEILSNSPDQVLFDVKRQPDYSGVAVF